MNTLGGVLAVLVMAGSLIILGRAAWSLLMIMVGRDY